MKKLILVSLVALCCSPLLAQGRSFDAMGFVTWVDLSGGDATFGDSLDAEIQFDGDQGFGLGINFFITSRLSAEITASEIKPESRVHFGDGTVAGELDMLPITGVIQYHFKPEGTFDPYIGAGVAYLIFDEFSSKDPNLDVSGVDIRNDYGAVLNIGFSWEFGYGFALMGDAKYVPTSNEITTNIGDATVDLNPLILSAGVMVRF